jgi:hypothetical protein
MKHTVEGGPPTVTGAHDCWPPPFPPYGAGAETSWPLPDPRLSSTTFVRATARLFPFTHVAIKVQVPLGASVGTAHLIVAEPLRLTLHTVNLAERPFAETSKLHLDPDLAEMWTDRF